MITRIPAAIFLIFAIVFIEVGTADASEKMVLQLAWKHQFQFAGYYAAMHKDYYKQAGLNVTIVEGGKGKFAREEVLSGRAQYGVAGAEALEKARNHSGLIDLLMTDVVMPEMNGRDLSVKITDHYPDIRLLFMPGYTANVIAHQGVLDDGVAFIQKLFSMADMTEKVREVLDRVPGKNQG